MDERCIRAGWKFITDKLSLIILITAFRGSVEFIAAKLDDEFVTRSYNSWRRFYLNDVVLSAYNRIVIFLTGRCTHYCNHLIYLLLVRAFS